MSMTKYPFKQKADYKEHQSPLLQDVRNCNLCAGKLPFDPRPVLNFTAEAKILIVGQAPGMKVQQTGIPWNDPSGDRLREWLAVDRQSFYNPRLFAIASMGFCYPGKGKSGDLPPRRECASTWMPTILKALPQVETILAIGRYSQEYFLGAQSQGVTNNVRNWRKFAPHIFPLPHPSPRNNLWLRRNPWFETDLLPYLKDQRHRLIRNTV